MLCIIAFMIDTFRLIPEAGMYLTGILPNLHAALRCRVLLLDVFTPFVRACRDILAHWRTLCGPCTQI